MPLFKLPLSGDVVQSINPITWFFSGNSVNVYLGDSSAPEVEAEVLDKVGTYGRQLGQITDALIVLLRHLPDREALAPDERKVLAKLEDGGQGRRHQAQARAAGATVSATIIAFQPEGRWRASRVCSSVTNAGSMNS